MSDKVIAVGDEIDSWCTKCKLMLAHTVQAMSEGTIEKVVCKTCKGKHKYRPNIPKSRQKKDPNAPAKKRVTRRRKKDPAVVWEEALEGRDTIMSKRYAMDGEFSNDQILEHPTFGIGLITEVRAEGKMEVLFKDGPKLLVCNR